MIKLTRIDDRLIHGQVAFTWVPSLQADCLVVANDKVAGDEFLKMTLTLAKPPSTKLMILTLANAALFLNDAKSKYLKILLLVNSVKDAAILSKEVSEITSVNFGGLRTREGANFISKAVAITGEDVSLIREMLDKGMELEVRQVPTDKKQLLQQLIS